MFEEGGRLIERVRTGKDIDALPKTFIGSSTEGLSLAKALSESLRNAEIAASEVWNEGTIFGLGAATLEALEQAVLQYDFGVFIFTPDDELRVRGKLKRVARDNVILELGLFIGKLTRRRAFIIRPSKKTIQLPSDLLGITTAEYDPDVTNLTVALKPACKQIRIAIDRANSQLRR
jgi:predicted nucleotide-binding protein